MPEQHLLTHRIHVEFEYNPKYSRFGCIHQNYGKQLFCCFFIIKVNNYVKSIFISIIMREVAHTYFKIHKVSLREHFFGHNLVANFKMANIIFIGW